MSTGTTAKAFTLNELELYIGTYVNIIFRVKEYITHIFADPNLLMHRSDSCLTQ